MTKTEIYKRISFVFKAFQSEHVFSSFFSVYELFVQWCNVHFEVANAIKYYISVKCALFFENCHVSTTWVGWLSRPGSRLDKTRWKRLVCIDFGEFSSKKTQDSNFFAVLHQKCIIDRSTSDYQVKWHSNQLAFEWFHSFEWYNSSSNTHNSRSQRQPQRRQRSRKH